MAHNAEADATVSVKFLFMFLYNHFEQRRKILYVYIHITTLCLEERKVEMKGINFFSARNLRYIAWNKL